MDPEKISITCISCPIGCSIDVTKFSDGFKVEGNECKKGEEYALQEVKNPMRRITSTVKTQFKDFPRLPVKTDSEVPLKDVFHYMKEINEICVSKRLKPGDIVKSNLRNREVNLVSTGDMFEIGK